MYIYNATGVKLKKTVNVSITDYAGNYIYENDELQFFNHPEGYATPVNAADYNSGFDYVYQYKDHLGNIRLSYTDNNGDLEIVEENNYYSFGLEHKEYNSNVSSSGNSLAQNCKYNGKELNEELGLNWYDFSARNYDAALGRWMNLDPLSEKYYAFTPYNYVSNSPVIAVDPDGMRIEYAYDKNKTRKENRQNRRKLRRSIRGRIRNSDTFKKLYNTLRDSELTYTIRVGKAYSGESGSFTETLHIKLG